MISTKLIYQAGNQKNKKTITWANFTPGGASLEYPASITLNIASYKNKSKKIKDILLYANSLVRDGYGF